MDVSFFFKFYNYMQDKEWHETLEFGKEFEREVLSYIQKTYPKATHEDDIPKMYEKEKRNWDILIPETQTKIECKRDRMSFDTGNIVVETDQDGTVESGIEHSEASWWVFKAYEKGAEKADVILINKSHLQRYCEGHNLRVVRGGYNNLSWMYLLKVADAKRIASKVIPFEEFVS